MSTQKTLSVYQKLAAIQAEVTGIIKDSKSHVSKYESLIAVIDELHPFHVKHKTCVTHTIDNLYLKTSFICSETGDKIEVACPILGWENALSGKSNPVQAMGAAITYLRRYNLKNLFNLYAEDDDAQSLTIVQSTPKTQVQQSSPKNNVAPVAFGVQTQQVQVAQPQVDLPPCPECQNQMMKSIYPDKVTGKMGFYCKPCKKLYPFE